MDKDLLIKRIELLCKERKIKPTTAYIESGVGKNFKSNLSIANPSLGKIILLAEYFNVSREYLLGETVSRVDTEETNSAFPDEQKLLNLYRSLNDEGKEKAVDYLDDLNQSGKYIKSNSIQLGKEEA